MEQSKIVWRYGVRCQGIKKRCRKIEWHSEKSKQGLKEIEGSPSPDEAISLARSWIFNNMKTCSKAYATAQLWTLQPNGIQTWQPITAEHNLKFPIEQISYAK